MTRPSRTAPLLDVIVAEAESFADLIKQGLQHVMTAHVVYCNADQDVATVSPFWVQQVLRSDMGFGGRIWSDDLCMKGVGDSVWQAAQAALKAGCDTLLVCESEGVRSVYENL